MKKYWNNSLLCLQACNLAFIEGIDDFGAFIPQTGQSWFGDRR